MSAQPGWLADGVFGWFHPPRGVTRRRAVLLVPTHGYDALCVHRAWASLADQLAGAGLPTLRVDLAGSGDSFGGDDEGERVAAWVAGVRASLKHLTVHARVDEVCVVGFKLGALLAAHAVSDAPQVKRVVLVAPPASGRLHVRELKALALTAPPVPGAPAPGPEAASQLEAGGFFHGAQTLQALEALEYPSLEGRTVLVLSRSDLPDDPKLARALAKTQATLEKAPLDGYPELMRDAHFSTTPEAAWSKVVAFAAEGALDGATSPVPLERRFTREGVTEEAVTFGDGLFGVLSVPEGRPAKAAVVVLNTGANPHPGASRLSVSLARRQAARGLGVFRLDAGGIGDASARPGSMEERLYSKRSCGDVRAALDLLEQRGFTRLGAAGLCSGAYLAFHTAVEDERLRALVLINAQRFAWRDGDSLDIAIKQSFKSTRFYVEQALNPEVWRRVAQGQVNVRGVAKVLAERGLGKVRRRLEGLQAKVLGGAPASESEVAKGFLHLLRRGVRVLLVYSAQDGGLDELDLHLGPLGEKLRGKGDATVELVEGADHTLTARWARQRVLQRLDTWLSPLV